VFIPADGEFALEKPKSKVSEVFSNNDNRVVAVFLTSMVALIRSGTPIKTGLLLKPLQCPGQNPDESIPFSRQYYFELVDWSGRILKAGKRGAIPGDTPPILTRLDINEEEWLKTVGWNNRFRRAVGKLAAMKAFAEKQGQQWFQGTLACRRLYSSAPL
ncbi:MAG: hypothetical protein RM811_016700, partial [Endozoicomonas sp.]